MYSNLCTGGVSITGIDASRILDILGNENRRRIIELLTDRPCYVTEISEYLKVAPKAVIDHLNILEEAGIVSSSIAECKRKYYNISYSMRLEISFSPYSYAVDFSNTENLSNSLLVADICEITKMCEEDHISRMKLIHEDLVNIRHDQKQLAQLQKELCSETDHLINEFLKSATRISNSDLETDILFRILKNHLSVSTLCDSTGKGTETIVDLLENFKEKGLLDKYIKEDDEFWHIKTTNTVSNTNNSDK